MNFPTFTFAAVVRASFLLAFTFQLFACATPASYQQFDFGSMPNTSSDTSAKKLAILLADIQVPASLEGTAMLYRLQYENGQELRPYAQSRWSMPPAQLLKQRIKNQLNQRGSAVLAATDGVKDLPLLRLELEEFAQHFSSPTQSQVQLRWRASLINKGQLIAQKVFQAQTKCESADAKGGAQAMPQATDLTITELITWLQTQVTSNTVSNSVRN
jgi:cholesterol transport system auxiliary component